jgi:aconitate decarboxylase
MNLTEKFVKLLIDGFSHKITETEVQVTSDLLLDGLSVAALGSMEAGPQMLYLMANNIDQSASATVIMGDRRVTPENAAQVNGAAMHVLDYEPMWNPANHSLSTTLPALLALSEMLLRSEIEEFGQSISGDKILKALAIGIETQARLRSASGQYEPGELVFHPPSTVGPLGSAIACGLIMGLSRKQLVNAIGIAGSMAGGLQGNIGSMTKALHCGKAAANGIQAALLARQGFTSDSNSIDGPRGYGNAFFGKKFNQSKLLEPKVDLHVVNPGPAYKLYPSQYGTHFVIEAALMVRNKISSSQEIQNVTIISPPMPYVDRPLPSSGLAGKFSFQYVAAIALIDGKVSVESFNDKRRFSKDVETLLPLIKIRPDPERHGRFDKMKIDIEVELSNGEIYSGTCDGPPGVWGRPAAPALLENKSRECLRTAFGEERGKSIFRSARKFANFDAKELLNFYNLLSWRP